MEDRQGGLNSGWLGGWLVATGYWLVMGGHGLSYGTLYSPWFQFPIKSKQCHVNILPTWPIVIKAMAVTSESSWRSMNAVCNTEITTNLDQK